MNIQIYYLFHIFLYFQAFLQKFKCFQAGMICLTGSEEQRSDFCSILLFPIGSAGQRDGAENGTARNAMPRHPLLSLMDQLREHPAQTPDAAFLEAVDVGLADAHGISGLRGGLLREVDRADDILLFGRESLHR